jgi:type IV pilus assembly protein PilP
MTHTIAWPLRIVLVGVVLFAVAGGGCGPEAKAPAPVVEKTIPKETAKAVEEAQPNAVSEVGKPPSFIPYNPVGKRDPFVAFLKVRKKETRPDLVSLPPLQRVELGELHFVGVIWSPKVTRALVEDSEGKGYTVKVGTKIGRGGGVVTRITDDEIFIREEFRDYAGARVKRESSLKLETVGGK